MQLIKFGKVIWSWLSGKCNAVSFDQILSAMWLQIKFNRPNRVRFKWYIQLVNAHPIHIYETNCIQNHPPQMLQMHEYWKCTNRLGSSIFELITLYGTWDEYFERLKWIYRLQPKIAYLSLLEIYEKHM